MRLSFENEVKKVSNSKQNHDETLRPLSESVRKNYSSIQVTSFICDIDDTCETIVKSKVKTSLLH